MQMSPWKLLHIIREVRRYQWYDIREMRRYQWYDIREMQMRTAEHLHTHQALTHISSDQNVKAEMERTPPVVRMQSSWSSHWSWWRRQSVQPLWRMVCQILVKLHIHLLLGNIPTRNEHLCAPKDLCENTHGSFTPNSQQLEENG